MHQNNVYQPTWAYEIHLACAELESTAYYSLLSINQINQMRIVAALFPAEALQPVSGGKVGL